MLPVIRLWVGLIGAILTILVSIVTLYDRLTDPPEVSRIEGELVPPPVERPMPKPPPPPEIFPPPAMENPWQEEARLEDHGVFGRVYFLAQEYMWGLGQTGSLSSESVQIYFMGQDPVEVQQFRQVLDQFHGITRQATDLIAVGTASCRGDVVRERRRALMRAERLADWLVRSYPPGVPLGHLNVHTLVLGQAQCPDPSGDRPEQRRIIVIALKRQAGSELDEGRLRDAMEASPALRVSPTHYNDFALSRNLF